MDRAWISWCVAALVVVALSFGPAPARAGEPSARDKAAARALANSGLAAFKKGDYETALERFESAEDIVHAPPHLLYQGRARAKLGQLLAARKLLQQVVDEQLGPSAPRPFRKAQDEAREDLEALEGQMPKVAIEIDGPSLDAVHVTIDGEAVTGDELSAPVPLDPGEHQIEASADGYESAQETVTLEVGAQTVSVALTLRSTDTGEPPDDEGWKPEQPDEQTADSDFPLGPVIVMSAGGVGLIVGGITGGLALSKAGELRDHCPSNPCPTEHQSLADDANTLGTVSTVSFIVGGVAVAAGGGWLLWELLGSGDEPSHGPDSARRVVPIIAPGYVGLVGAF